MESNRFFSQMFSQISCTPDFEQISFRVKRCGLYAGVYRKCLFQCHDLFCNH